MNYLRTTNGQVILFIITLGSAIDAGYLHWFGWVSISTLFITMGLMLGVYYGDGFKQGTYHDPYHGDQPKLLAMLMNGVLRFWTYALPILGILNAALNIYVLLRD